MNNLKEELKSYKNLFIELSTKIKIILLCALLVSIFIITYEHLQNGNNVLQLLSIYGTLLFMLTLAVIDAKLYIIPNSILIMWLVFRLIFIALEVLVTFTIYPVISSFLGAFIVFMLFLAVYYITKRSLGGGDVKLSFVLGLSLTTYFVFTAVFYALLLSAVFSIIALATKKLTRKDALPLGPFLFLGTVAAYLALII